MKCRLFHRWGNWEWILGHDGGLWDIKTCKRCKKRESRRV